MRLIWDYIEPAPAFIDPAAPPGSASHFLGRNFQDFPAMWRSDLGTASENADTDQAGYQYVNERLRHPGGRRPVRRDPTLRLALSLRQFGLCPRHELASGGLRVRPHLHRLQGNHGADRPAGGAAEHLSLYQHVAVRVFEPASRRWLVEFSARLVAAQDYVATSIDEISTPGYVTFALRGHYRVNDHLRLSVSLENLLNRSYIEPGSLAIVNAQGVPAFVREPGFTALLGMEARF